jgi:rSAM/selenodomain-associated transferase 2
MISVVIPTLNAASTLEPVLASLREGGELVGEVVVSDGGSLDGTAALASAAGCRVVSGGRSRGVQLAQGAEAATGPWLLFLHADTQLAPGWSGEVGSFIDAPGSEESAAVFAFALDDDSRSARWLEAIVAVRVRSLAMPYGDQGLLVSRRLYDRVGGFRPIPLMEDVDLVRRIGRRRVRVLATRAVTSAARYRRSGYLPRMARNAACLLLYFAGLPPRTIARLYG